MSKAIDVNEFTDTLTPGSQGSYRWTHEDEESGTITWAASRDTDHNLVFRLKFTVTNRRTGSVDQ